MKRQDEQFMSQNSRWENARFDIQNTNEQKLFNPPIFDLPIEDELVHLFVSKTTLGLYIQDLSLIDAYLKKLMDTQKIKNLKAYLCEHRDIAARLSRLVKIKWANPVIEIIYKSSPVNGFKESYHKTLQMDNFQSFIELITSLMSGLDSVEGNFCTCDLENETIKIHQQAMVRNRKVNGLSNVIVSVYDLSEITQLRHENRVFEKQVCHTQKMETLGILAGGIAHDFNNMLFPVLGYTEMLLEDVTDIETKEMLKKIKKSALRAKDLVRQILTFARNEKNELSPVQVQPLIKEVLRLLRTTVPKTIMINQQIDPNCRIIEANVTQLYQIIMNLVMNAYHSMEGTDGIIDVSLKEIEVTKGNERINGMPGGRYACIKVSDTGTGMDNALIKQIFSPAFSTKPRGKGTGMGLTIVKSLVHDMGGYIGVESSEGIGSTFTLFFPIFEFLEKRGNHHNDEITIELPWEKQGKALNVLVVDDEEVILDIETDLLTRLGFKVKAISDPLDALEVFRKNPQKFDLVITDLSMPNMMGDEFALEISKTRPGVPIILCTGFHEKTISEIVGKKGIKGVIIKPVRLEALSEKIQEIIANDAA